MAWYSQYLVMIHKSFHRTIGKNSSVSSSESIIPELRIIQHKEHGLIRNNISSCATKVTLDLQEAGYSAFIVGGAVRDLLLGLKPKISILLPMPSLRRSALFSVGHVLLVVVSV